VARAHQAKLHYSVDDVDELDISSVRLQSRPDEIDRLFNSPADLIHE
jgi:hypothetical protein